MHQEASPTDKERLGPYAHSFAPSTTGWQMSGVPRDISRPVRADRGNGGDRRSASSLRRAGKCQSRRKLATAAWSSVSIYNGTITFCAVPLISIHRQVDGR